MCSFLSLFSFSSKVPTLAVTATAINILCIKAIYLHTAQYLCSSLHSLSWSRNSTHFTEPSPLPLTQHTTFRFSYDSICIFHLNHAGYMPCLSHPHWPANPTNSTLTAHVSLLCNCLCSWNNATRTQSNRTFLLQTNEISFL